MRGLDVGLGVGVRGGAHAGLVGEQAALGALEQGRDEAVGHAAHLGLGVEGAVEDELDGRDDVSRVGDEDGEAADEVDDGHEGDHLLDDGGEALDVAEVDETGQNDDGDANRPRGDARRGVEGGRDGVRLDHGSEEAEGENGGDGEERGQELAEGALEGVLHVVDRAALDLAVLGDGAGLLRENGLGVVGGHAEEGDDPHPEDGARAADEDGAAGSDDVAGADLGGDGGGDGLERAHAALLLAAAQAEVAEEALEALAEVADLHEARADGEEQAHADQQEDEDVVPQVAVYPNGEIQCPIHTKKPPSGFPRKL